MSRRREAGWRRGPGCRSRLANRYTEHDASSDSRSGLEVEIRAGGLPHEGTEQSGKWSGNECAVVRPIALGKPSRSLLPCGYAFAFCQPRRLKATQKILCVAKSEAGGTPNGK